MIYRKTEYGRCSVCDYDGTPSNRYIGNRCETLEQCADVGNITELRTHDEARCDCCYGETDHWFIMRDHSGYLAMSCPSRALDELAMGYTIDTTGSYYSDPDAIEQITERA